MACVYAVVRLFIFKGKLMIIVTGGAGFIGSNIIRALNKKGITNILVVDNLKNSIKFLNLVDLHITDYIDKDDFLVRIMSGEKINNLEAVFHKGACSSTNFLNGKYMMDNNYQYSKHLLNYCVKRNIPFLYASSASIYGNRISNFIESYEYEKPINIYGYSKYLFDEYVRQVLSKTNSQIVGFRYFNVYGPNESHKEDMASIVFHLNNQIINDVRPTLFEGSEQFQRDFIFVEDVVSANLWFLENNVSGIFNLGTGCAESFKKVASTILSYHNQTNYIKYIPFPLYLKNCYQQFTKADLTNLRSAGYEKSFTSISEGIKKYMHFLNKKHQEL